MMLDGVKQQGLKERGSANGWLPALPMYPTPVPRRRRTAQGQRGIAVTRPRRAGLAGWCLERRALPSVGPDPWPALRLRLVGHVAE